MRLAIVGGSQFLGREIAAQAIAAGYTVVVFHRGVQGDDVPGVELRRADRNQPGSLAAALGTDRFDSVVDTCTQSVAWVQAATEQLAARTERYLFTSTVSVYDGFPAAGMDESASVLRRDGPVDDHDIADYGYANVRCEDRVREVFGAGATIVRPGLIVGRGDGSDRFGYWVVRGLRPGPVLAPGRPTRPVQFIDVVDLAGFCLRLLAGSVSGTFNAVGDPRPMAKVLAACGIGDPVWVSDEQLVRAEVGPYLEMPLWVPEEEPGWDRLSNAAARRAGLTFRPLADTVADALAHERMLGLDRPRRAGLAPDRERELLKEAG